MNYKITKKQFTTFALLSAMTYMTIGYGMYRIDGIYNERATTVASLRQENKDLLDRVAAANTVASLEDEIEQAEALTASFLPTTKKQSELIAEIEAVANGVMTLSGINFDATAAEPNALTQTTSSVVVSGVLEFPFDVNGSVENYEDLIVFLQSFEANRRKFQISNINITPEGDEGESLERSRFLVTINGRVFLQGTN